MIEVHVNLTIRRDRDSGWHVAIDPETDKGFASVSCGDLHDALRMAVPYIACAAEGDPIRDMLTQLANGGRARCAWCGCSDPADDAHHAIDCARPLG